MIRKLNNIEIIIIVGFIFLAVFCFMNRYEYTKSPIGRINQRINKITGNVEILCSNCKNESYWQNGNKCLPNVTRQEIIDYGYYNNKSIDNINKALEKNCFYLLNDTETNWIKKK